MRKAAGQIASQFIALATKELADNSASVLSKLTYCFDGDEATFISGKRLTSLAPPQGDYFTTTEGVLIEVSAAVCPGYKVSAGDINSAYFYSLEDLDDYGAIVVSISLPHSVLEASQFLPGLLPELRGHLAHEMQHSIQKIVYGQPLSDTLKTRRGITPVRLEGS